MGSHIATNLGKLAREADCSTDTRLKALTEGRLSTTECAKLAKDAQQSSAGPATIQAFQPLDSHFRERLVDSILLHLAAEREHGCQFVTAPPPPKTLPPPPTPVRLRNRLALAAVVASVSLLAPLSPLSKSTTPSASHNISAKEAARPLPSFEPLEVEFAGCTSVLKNATCQLPADGYIQLWIKQPEGHTPEHFHLQPLADSKPVPILQSTRIQGGTSMAVQVPTTASHLVLYLQDSVYSQRRSPLWQLHLTTRTAEATLTTAENLRTKGNYKQAQSLLQPLLDDKRDWVRTRALGNLARIHAIQNNMIEAIPLFEKALELDQTAGEISREFLDRFALAFYHIYTNRSFVKARETLEPLKTKFAQYPEGQIMARYYEGLLAFETGNVKNALRLFQASSDGAARLKLQRERLDALTMQTNTILTIGRHEEASALIGELARALPEVQGCRRAEILNNIGWFSLANPALDQINKTITHFEDARAIYRNTCKKPEKLANTLINLARAHLLNRNANESLTQIQEAKQVVQKPSAHLAVEWTELEANIALQQKQPARALALYEHLKQLGQSGSFEIALFRAEVGRAQALEALERFQDADMAYAQSEQLLDARSLLIPLGEGRQRFLNTYDEGVLLYLDFLVRRASPQKAVDAARQSRARLLRTIDRVSRIETLTASERKQWDHLIARYRHERAMLDKTAANDWRLPADALARAAEERKAHESRLRDLLDQALGIVEQKHPVSDNTTLGPPDPGEALLVYHPVKNGWIGFAVTSDTIVVERIPKIELDGSKRTLADQLLKPFTTIIDHASKLRFLPYGTLARIDFHGLPWKDAPLLTHVPVSYGVDLPYRNANLPTTSKTALLVTDPLGDLNAARKDGPVISSLLQQKPGWQIQWLDGENATHDQVLQHLESSDTQLFHYAGHGFFRGLDGWDSGLPLASSGSLTIHDILALSHVPNIIVLAACQTGAAESEAGAEGLGIAQAFLTAGADAVIAATRNIDDQLASFMINGFYKASVDLEPSHIAAALRNAQLAARAAFPDADWEGVRVLVR